VPFWCSGLLFPYYQPEPIQVIGSVVTYQVFWGNSPEKKAGSTQDRMSLNPLRLPVPAFLVRWRIDGAPPLLIVLEAGIGIGSVVTYQVSWGIDLVLKPYHPRPYKPKSDRKTNSPLPFTSFYFFLYPCQMALSSTSVDGKGRG
jgi:hypothetical protein